MVLVPEIPTLASLGVIVGILLVMTLTSLSANRCLRESATQGAGSPAADGESDALVAERADRAQASDRHS